MVGDAGKPRQIVSAVRKSANLKATRSLSATVHKRAATSIEEGVATAEEVENVLEAVQAENTMVDGTTTSKKSTQPLSATMHKRAVPLREDVSSESVEDILEAVHAENARVDSARGDGKLKLDDATSVELPNPVELPTSVVEPVELPTSVPTSVELPNPVELPTSVAIELPTSVELLTSVALPTPQSQVNSLARGSALNSSGTSHQTLAGQFGDTETGGGGSSSKPSFPLKPVLLKYNTSKPSLHPAKPSKEAVKPELGETHEGEGGEEDVVSHSLTERTLRVITDRVRNMDAK